MLGELLSINCDYKDDWIINFGYKHYLIGDDSKFITVHHYEGNVAVVMPDNTSGKRKKCFDSILIATMSLLGVRSVITC